MHYYYIGHNQDAMQRENRQKRDRMYIKRTSKGGVRERERLRKDKKRPNEEKKQCNREKKYTENAEQGMNGINFACVLHIYIYRLLSLMFVIVPLRHLAFVAYLPFFHISHSHTDTIVGCMDFIFRRFLFSSVLGLYFWHGYRSMTF